MDRRDFLRLGLAGVTVGACEGGNKTVAYPGSGAPAPPTDMDAFFARLDDGLLRIRDGNPMAAVFEEGKLGEPRLSPAQRLEAEELYRKSLRSLLLVGSYRDLPPDERSHPRMLERLSRGCDEMDEATLGMARHLEGLEPSSRSAIQARLRARPELGMAIGKALDVRAAQIGISIQRRTHLQSMSSQVLWRLRALPIGTVLDEQTALIRSVADRQYRRVLSDIREIDTSQFPEEQKRGTGVLRVGAILLGVAGALGLVGAAVVGSGNIAGLFVLTPGALLLLTGLILVIVGAAM